MKRDRPVPGSPQHWLARAKSDLAIASAPLPDGALYEDLCFHCQQAAEKALKAVYHKGLSFRYSHDISEFIEGLRSQGINIPSVIQDSIFLTTFAWETRYPGLGEPVTIDEYRESLQHAENVINWAEQMIGPVYT